MVEERTRIKEALSVYKISEVINTMIKGKGNVFNPKKTVMKQLEEHEVDVVSDARKKMKRSKFA